MQEYEENQKRPGIDTLIFKKVDPAKAEEVRAAKTGLFGGGTKKKLAASIEAGRTTYAEVLALARMNRDIDRSAEKSRFSDLYECYYKIADLDGNVLREDIPAIENEFAVFLSTMREIPQARPGAQTK